MQRRIRKKILSPVQFREGLFLSKSELPGLSPQPLRLWPAALGDSEHGSNPGVGTESAEDVISEVSQDIEKENTAMPLIKIDAFEGQSESEVATLLDAVHRAVVIRVELFRYWGRSFTGRGSSTAAGI